MNSFETANTASPSPFSPHYIKLEQGTIHYIDEGTGEVLLFVHGTPTWSYLYRNLITHFKNHYRCIATDNLGFGLSTSSPGFPGTPEAHSEVLSNFIQTLDLNHITLIVHDFGGPIGLAAGIENNPRIKRVVAFNTWLWETKTNPEAQKANKILQTWIGKFLYINMNFSVNVLLKKAFYNKKKLTASLFKAYKFPFLTRKSRHSALQLGKSLMGSSDWYDEQYQQIGKLKHLPWLFIWGEKDPYLGNRELIKWKEVLPEATYKLVDAGHFVQEEQPEKAIQHLETFLNETSM